MLLGDCLVVSASGWLKFECARLRDVDRGLSTLKRREGNTVERTNSGLVLHSITPSLLRIFKFQIHGPS